MSSSQSRIPSPARSMPMTPRRRYTPRKTRSVCSPARSNASGRLSSIIRDHQAQALGSFAVSPLNRKSVLTDNTCIDDPDRESWWRDLGEDSRDVMEVVMEDNAVEPRNIFENIEIVSQEEKRYTLDFPDTSDSESIQSIVIPQRKLFHQKENRPQKKFNQFVTKETVDKGHETHNITSTNDKAVTKELFPTEARSRPIFPAALLDISANTTASDRTMAVEPKRIHKLFSNQPNENKSQQKKRKNMFAKFIASDSEEELPEIQPKYFALQKKPDSRRPSLASRGADTLMTSSMDIELDDWQLLPSSTMVDHQLNTTLTDGQQPKRLRLSKLSEAETGTNSADTSKSKSKKSLSLKNKSIQEKSPQQNMSIVTRNSSKLTRNADEELNKTQNKSPSSSDISQTSIVTQSQNKSDIANKSYNSSVMKSRISNVKDMSDVANKLHLSTSKNKSDTANKSELLNKSDKSNKLRQSISKHKYDIANKSHHSFSKNISDTANKSHNSLSKNVSDIAIESHQSLTKNKFNVANKSQNVPFNMLRNSDKSLNENKSSRELNSDEVACSKNVSKNSVTRNTNDKELENELTKPAEDDVLNFSLEYEDNSSDEKEKADLTINKNALNKSNREENASKTNLNENIDSNETSTRNVSIDKTDSTAIQQIKNKVIEESAEITENSHSHITTPLGEKDVNNVEILNQNENSQKGNVEDKEQNISLKSFRQSEDIENRDKNINRKEQSQENNQDDNEKDLEDKGDEKNTSGLEKHEDEENEIEEILNKSQENHNESVEEQNKSHEEKNEIQEVQNESHNESREHNKSQEEQNEIQEEQNESHEVQNESHNDSREEHNKSQEMDSKIPEIEVESQEVPNVSQDENQEIHNVSQNENQEIQDDEEDENESQEMHNVSQDENQEVQDDEEEEEHNESQDENQEMQDDEEEQNESGLEDSESQEEYDEEQNISEEEIQQNETEDQEMEYEEANESTEAHSNQDNKENGGDQTDDQESDQENEEHEENETEAESDRNDNQESVENEIENSPNVSYDTTGRNRKKNLTVEAVLRNIRTEVNLSAVHRENTSTRKTKSNIHHPKMSLDPGRESIELSHGTNSSAEGSGWDSHRTTRKTLRQTFGKDFTPRKSLRALVMEKSAKRRATENNMSGRPQANSTEFPEPDLSTAYPPSANDEMNDPPVSEHEVSIRTRQARIEEYLKIVKRDHELEKAKVEKAVKYRLEHHKTRLEHGYIQRPMWPPQQTKPKPKVKKPSQPFKQIGNLPDEFMDDLKYKPPKRFAPRNASWLTKRLYKYLETKLEPKYNYKARVRAEKFAQMLYEFVKRLRSRGAPVVAPPSAVDELKREMARLNFVRTHYDFYNFFNEFMPREVLVKVIPDVVNKIPLPRNGVFSDIL